MGPGRGQDSEHTRYYRSDIRLQAVALILVAVGLTLTGWQAHESRRSVELASRTLEQTQAMFAADQAPYVGICTDPDEKSKFTLEAGKPFRWRVKFLNYGKSPALRMQMGAALYAGEGAVESVRDFFALIDGSIFPAVKATAMVMPNATACGADGGFTDVVTNRVGTKEDLAFMAANDGGLALAGRFQYRDIRGAIYNSDFCLLRLQTGAIMTCPGHNDVTKAQ